MSEKSKPKIKKSMFSPALRSYNLPLFLTVPRKFPIGKKIALATLSVFVFYAFINAFLLPNLNTEPLDLDPIRRHLNNFPGDRNFPGDGNFPARASKPRVYMYNLPTKFTFGIIEQHGIARGGEPAGDITALKYPGHQHMHEWFLFSDLNRPENERVGSPVVRVSDPAEADLFYVPAFSSLSLIVNSGRPGNESDYSDEKMQESLVDWLEGQQWWQRNKGRDHVIIAGDPNALNRVMDRVKNAVLLVADFGRLRPDQGSIVKDVVIPYSHRIDSYEGELGVKNRSTLLFFMGNRYRKDGGKVRDLLFNVLEKEEGVMVKEGTQSQQNRRAARQGMHTSKFCLHPAGDTPSACRLFDSIVSLCVPVIVSDSIELPFEDVIDYPTFSIFVGSKNALKRGFLVKKLRKIKPQTILKYQKTMKEVRRYFDYTHGDGAVNEIWRQVTMKLPLIKLMINRDKRIVSTRLRLETNCSCICSN